MATGFSPVGDATQAERAELETEHVVHPGAQRRVPWERSASELFRERMLDEVRVFPCTFGVGAVRSATLRYAFVPAGDGRVDRLAAALEDFIPMAAELGKRTSLVAFFEPAETVRTLDEHRAHFWELLQSLHLRDTEPWPSGISRDPEDSEWEFSYGGMPFFVVANTPAHARRASRFFEYFTITFQPRFVFDDLAADTEQGQKARKVIRQRLAAYDAVEPSPELGSFGVGDNREWVQYFLEEDNDAAASQGKCPLRMRAL